MLKPVQASTYTFRHIIEGGFLYVDKTRYLYDLVRPGTGIYFLARPRRFGKSLMISTLEEIFLGHRELFQGLWIDTSDYGWQSYPVIRIDFSQERIYSAKELQNLLTNFTEEIAETYKITLPKSNYQRQFRQLIQRMAQQEKVIILIDEYDKPLIDNLEDLAEAKLIRDVLKNFYSIIKAMDQHIRFVCITGISKFSKVGIFSSLNNLDDLTMDPRFATMLGITEDELQLDFQEHITAFAVESTISNTALLEQIREWYNGFCFVEGCASLYNPFSTLQLFSKKRFANYWFDSGTPTFLIKLLKANNYPIAELEKLVLKEIDFSTYELEQLDVVPLLFQTGYLTIKDYEKKFGQETVYHLSYPNREVENAFVTHLLSAFSQLERTLTRSHLYQLLDALQKRDLEQMFITLHAFFANVPYTLTIDKEAYYQTIFYIIFKMIGIETEAEVVTNNGRIDAVVALADHIFIFEFKLNGTAAAALDQIKRKEYFQKYWVAGKPITCVGANFATESRTIDGWESEEMPVVLRDA